MNQRYLQIIGYMTYARLKAESARTYIGFLWWFIEPVMYMAVYYFVFGVIFKSKQEHFVEFLFIGLVMWRWFHASLIHAAASILENKQLMQKVFVPKAIYPLVLILMDTIKFMAVFVVLLVFLSAMGHDFNLSLLALLPIILLQFLLLLGLGFVCAGVTPFIPDLPIFLDNVLRGLMFVSGVFFAIDQLSPQLQFYLNLNPMAIIITATRDVLLQQTWPDWQALLQVFTLSILSLSIGFMLIRRNEYNYPKVCI